MNKKLDFLFVDVEAYFKLLIDIRLFIIQTLGHIVFYMLMVFFNVSTMLTWKVILSSVVFYICFYPIVIQSYSTLLAHMTVFFSGLKDNLDSFQPGSCSFGH